MAFGRVASIMAPFFPIDRAPFSGLTTSALIMCLSFVALGSVPSRSVSGRDLLATGGNIKSTQLTGPQVTRLRAIASRLKALRWGWAAWR